MNVQAIATLETNYVWVLHPSSSSNHVYVVDPGQAKPVIQHLSRHSLSLAGILITHHHWDHTDGLDDILAEFPVPVFGPKSVPQITQPVKEGDALLLDGFRLEVLAVPGHTLDHVAYFLPEEQETPPRLFCGDALFAGGCGRLFEGTPEQALLSLKKLAGLPSDTLIYCAHEYTLANLAFALKAEPDNSDTIDRQRREENKIRENGITLPSLLEEELGTNPFLRCQEPMLKETVESHWGTPLESEASVFAALRRWKDNA